jgi:hypothetical protein
MLQMPLGTWSFATEQADGPLEEQAPPPLICVVSNLRKFAKQNM